MYGILWGMVTSSLNIFLVNSFLASKFTGLTVCRQLRSVMPVAFLTLLCIVVGYGMSHLKINIIIVSVIYVSMYILLSVLLRVKALNDTAMILKKIVTRKHEA